jgi:hypothetical protein
LHEHIVHRGRTGDCRRECGIHSFRERQEAIYDLDRT